jgi:hypothetical protein
MLQDLLMKPSIEQGQFIIMGKKMTVVHLIQ